MPRCIRPLPCVVLALLAGAPAAGADPLIVSAPGAKNLAAGAGWRAWAAPRDDGRWRLMIRAPGGHIAAAAIRDFGSPPDASIGTVSTLTPGDRRFVAVYSRCSGFSTTQGCDIYRYDLAARIERKMKRFSTGTGSETAPSVSAGSYAFVRRGGHRPGTYTATRSRLRRIDSRLARETAVTQSRVAFRTGAAIYMSQLNGRRRRTIATGLGIFSVVITRYRVGWLQRAGHRTLAYMTDRIDPSGNVTIRQGRRDLPASTQSAVADASRIVEYLGATGVKRAVPPLFR